MQVPGKWQRRVVNPHTLAMADTYISLLRAERDNKLSIEDCRLEKPVGSVIADMAVDLSWYDEWKPKAAGYYLEIDMGTERPKIIREKLAGYLDAWSHSKGAFPYVVFVCFQDWRVVELSRVIGDLKAEDRQLFKVCHVDTVIEELMHV